MTINEDQDTDMEDFMKQERGRGREAVFFTVS
jgi:hypothetical protein